MTFSSTLLTSVQFTSYDYIKPNLEEKHVQVIPFAIFSDNSPAIFKNFYCGWSFTKNRLWNIKNKYGKNAIFWLRISRFVLNSTCSLHLFVTMVLVRGVGRGWSWGARNHPPSSLWDNNIVLLIIQMAKTHESEESTCNKSFPVQDSYLLHLQDLTASVDHVLVRN